ncbi:recombination mediator RecR [Sulfurihydrogenibium sp.]|uniref:recombination mediator RecR n=1 Tax=Sulfurihydrogenibium sp. TaxID=2053621 RepID=UPI002605EA48|nr:recombination mediator RecR [Sulfurihydrogenibium sp.]
MNYIPQSLAKVIEEISNLPGYGEKSAQRFATNLLKMPRSEAVDLVRNLAVMLDKIHPCLECGIYTEEDICPICKSTERDKGYICVVEESFDAYTIEKTGKFSGVYHVLGGRLSPLEGIGPDKLNIKSLIERIKKYSAKEVLIATNPTVEGEATANYIHNLLKKYPLNITRLAYGLPFGSVLENADEFTLSKALEHRIKV